MRGKSVDIEYIAVFVEQCVEQSKVTPKDITSEAKIKINNIDHEIRRIENLKSERSKLLDVVNSFDLPSEESEEPETQFTNFECMEDPFTQEVCRFVAQTKSISAKEIFNHFGEGLREQIIFSLKKLAEAGLIARRIEDRNFVIGPKWEELSEEFRA